MANEAVMACCSSVAKELGIDWEVRPVRKGEVVANPAPGGFAFTIRWGHFDDQRVSGGQDVVSMDSFHLPPDRNQWPLWLDYLGFLIRFHWARMKIGDDALRGETSCAGVSVDATQQ